MRTFHLLLIKIEIKPASLIMIFGRNKSLFGFTAGQKAGILKLRRQKGSAQN
jgi:hypothetical protein